jgi:hypothetical protein
MAAWQASFNVELDRALDKSEVAALADLLPPAASWSPTTLVWGDFERDVISLSWEDELPPEVAARFDLRDWKPTLYAAFERWVAGCGGRLSDAETGRAITASEEALQVALRDSRAFRFVRDPKAYFEELRRNPIDLDRRP